MAPRILEDLKTMMVKQVLIKYAISGTGLRHLRQRHGALINTKDITSVNTTDNNHHRPIFPVWSDKWDPAVQVKWLEVYQVIRQ